MNSAHDSDCSTLNVVLGSRHVSSLRGESINCGAARIIDVIPVHPAGVASGPLISKVPGTTMSPTGHNGVVMATHQRNFRRGGKIVGYAGRPLARFRSLPTHQSTLDALESPCVIAANHRSVFDAVAGVHAVAALGHTARVLSAAWLWEDQRLGRLLDSIGAIPLHGGRAAVATVEKAVGVLRSGEHLLMTPEGRVVPEDERTNGVGEGRKILSKIATAADVQVIPGALVGTDGLWHLDSRRPVVRPWDRPVIGYGFGPPVACLSTSHRENVDAVMGAISSLIIEIEPLMPVRG